MVSTHDDDTDPTGMRALLRGLPDPGPMPDGLVSRIQASLEDLSGTSDVDDGDAHRGRSLDGDVSRGTVVSHRPSWLARHGSKLAVAAVLVVGGGAAVQLVGSGLATGGSDAASDGSAQDGGAESLAGSPAAPGRTDGDSDTDSADRAPIAGPILVTMSGRSYTTDGLADQVPGRSTGSPVAPLTAESPGIGPIGTEIGVRSCLEGLGVPRATAAEVDLGFVDGEPAAVVVVTAGGERTAYAVRRECSVGNPAIIAGPVALP